MKRGIESERLQFGALCWKRKKSGVRILLITSRRRQRWVTPKGWPMPGKSPAAAAAQEAWEEAGVRGQVSPHPIGVYRYRKDLGRGRSIMCRVQMFPLEVKKIDARFPEEHERRSKWMKPKKAAKSVEEPDLAKLIRRFGKDAS